LPALSKARIIRHGLRSNRSVVRPKPRPAAHRYRCGSSSSREIADQLFRSRDQIGLGLALVGLLGVTRVMERRHVGRDVVPDIPVTLPGGHLTMMTFGQVASLFILPLGVVLAVVAFSLNRRFTREAMANPVTAGIFDPSVEWPDHNKRTDQEGD
jgi:hypothetical protein